MKFKQLIVGGEPKNFHNFVFFLRSTAITTMNLSDKCSVCEKSLKYQEVINLSPCNHKVHRECFNFISGDTLLIDMTCPFCGESISDSIVVKKTTYKKHPNENRQLILETGQNCGDWKHLANVLNINLATAESWLRTDRSVPLPKGGNRPKSLTEEQLSEILDWLAEDPQRTLVQIQEEINQKLHLSVSISTISKALHGKGVSVKKVHAEPEIINTPWNKLKRRNYVLELQRLQGLGKIRL